MAGNNSWEHINLDEIKDLIAKKHDIKLKNILENIHSADVAEVINHCGETQGIYLFKLLDAKTAAEVFINLDRDFKILFLNELSGSEINQIVNLLYADDIVDILDQMPQDFVKKLISFADREKRKEINTLLNYEENSAGAMMSVDYVRLFNNEIVAQALEKVKKLGERAENGDNYYVTDSKNKLMGVISLRSLVFADSATFVSDVMESNVISVNADDDQEVVANIVQKYDLNEIAVVNQQEMLIGIITVDDILDVIEEEATEDIEKLAAIKPTDMLYLETPVWKIVRSRVFWLLFLLISATFSELVIDAFLPLFGASNRNDNLHKVITFLIPLLPIIADTAGNSGSQASTTIVRSLSLGDVTLKDYRKVMWKELQVAFYVGFVLIFFNLIRMIIINLIRFNGTILWEQWAAMITLTISLWIVVVISKVVGGVLPIIAKLFRLDPAVMAAPLITTIIDALSTTIFFSIALIFFGQTMTT